MIIFKFFLSMQFNKGMVHGILEKNILSFADKEIVALVCNNSLHVTHAK